MAIFKIIFIMLLLVLPKYINKRISKRLKITIKTRQSTREFQSGQIEIMTESLSFLKDLQVLFLHVVFTVVIYIARLAQL